MRSDRSDKSDRSNREAYQYWRSRRSAKVFPIEGVTEAELRAGLQEFLVIKLNMPSDGVGESEVEHVRRVRLRRGKQNLNEVIVLFADIDTRDRVVSYARNLAPFVDQAGKPTAGIRFDIPDHLSGVHRTLLQYGHAMWEKHNRDKGFKRNIRFDETEQAFCMDIKFPHREDWITVDHRRALVDRRASDSALADDVGELLSSARELQRDEQMDRGGQLAEATGTSGPTGTVTSLPWRCPTKK